MKTFLFTFFILTTAAYATAQKAILDDTKTVISAAGSSFENEEVSLSWTLGNTLIYTNSEVKQAFTLEIFDLAENIAAFPNPVYDHVIIQTDTPNDNMQAVIYDIYGMKLLQKRMHLEWVVIDLADLPPSLYFIRILNADDQPVKTFKIVKN